MEGLRKVLRGKIHRAIITHADLDYEGSITVAPELLSAAGIEQFEAVNIWNVTNGNRFETYTIHGEPGSSSICINGAAAHLVSPGDIVIIACFEYLPSEQVAGHKPQVVFVDENNRITSGRPEVATKLA
jgi:aspartate 1-decarboxylase